MTPPDRAPDALAKAKEDDEWFCDCCQASMNDEKDKPTTNGSKWGIDEKLCPACASFFEKYPLEALSAKTGTDEALERVKAQIEAHGIKFQTTEYIYCECGKKFTAIRDFIAHRELALIDAESTKTEASDGALGGREG